MKNKPGPIWSSRQLSRNVFEVTIQAQRNKDFRFRSLLTSDRHWDNPHSDHKLQIKHMKEADECGACIVDAGDFFCAMQGRFDRRGSKSSVRKEHQNEFYLDSLVKTASDFFQPWAHLFVAVAMGNHEQSIVDHHETNLIDRFCGTLNDRTGSHIRNGGFSGWVIYRFLTGQGKFTNPVILHYDHGYGGGGPVTADMIQHQRRAVYLPDANIVISGHTHDAWERPIARVRLTTGGAIYHDEQQHIKVPTYKDEYGDGYGGWATAKKGMPPKIKGAYWLEFFWDVESERMKFSVIRAQ